MTTGKAEGLLYDPRDEHDACGVGFVANVSGLPSHGVLKTALEALRNLGHRGGVGADGMTGDGAGVLTQLPVKFFEREASRAGFLPFGRKNLSVGMFFLPRDEGAACACCEIVEQIAASHGLVAIGWRRVPADSAALGPRARSTLPRIEQLLLCADRIPAHKIEGTLYRVRIEIEDRCSDLAGFYISSLSSRTIVYKGLLSASQLGLFYPDLTDPDFETALAVMHQRYSTNTFPNWSLAQPFRLAAHNGEINTIAGNRNWMRARDEEHNRRNPANVTARLRWEVGSDSQSLDKAVESLVRGGRDICESVMTLIPEAYENNLEMDRDVRAFYEYSACSNEPWDGPAAIAFSDGIIVGAALDRNGLRPARYQVTNDGRVILASEAGAVALDPETVLERGRLGPGDIFAVDTGRGSVLRSPQIKKGCASNRPYAESIRTLIMVGPSNTEQNYARTLDEKTLISRMKAFGYTAEDVDRILQPMIAEGKEPIGSMGDDTPLALLSTKPRLLYSYFKQRFAQVTNPAIDPIRERFVMSLQTKLGPRSVSPPHPLKPSTIKLPSPILSNDQLSWLTRADGELRCATLAVLFSRELGGQGLRNALDDACEKASSAIESGAAILILSDLESNQVSSPIPMLLAVGAVHNHLIRCGLRMRASLIARTGEARDDHQAACLIGSGANAVNPCLAYEVVALEASKHGFDAASALHNYKQALETGLLKIMAKMGISTVESYCGAQAFETVGIDSSVIDLCFTGIASRISGIGLDGIANDVARFHESAYEDSASVLEDAGFFRYRNGGEYHSYNPSVFRALHRTALAAEKTEYDRYSREVLGRKPMVLRDLIDFRVCAPVGLEEVEPVEDILQRFSTSGMSLGALSREAHQVLAIAMNRMGGKSNSGEGGEDPRRFKRLPGGEPANSRIKQVASARFGVTPEYLVSADELEIKIAQGSKPGEGGQLPGHKVTAEIAAIRHSVPGVTLISPPPHHDIYSIEDLEQLIYDLKQVNPEARVAVKLVSEAGIGTIAVGVAKAHADVIHISGHDGGTGASPLGSIKNAGTPWEVGLAETQQALVLNDLRGRVRLRVDGGLKTGRDVVIAAMLGAEEFGFATAALVSLGCVMARQCHLNTCPVGIATQKETLRRKFTGRPENIINLFRSLAEDIRQMLARLGARRLDEIVGRSELLVPKTETTLPRMSNLDLTPMLKRADDGSGCVRFDAVPTRLTDEVLGTSVERFSSEAISSGRSVAGAFAIKATDRAVGARLAGSIARGHGDAGLPEGSIDLMFTGSAGQSFGAFNISGMRLTLIGEANDYVGKGMSGGEIIIRPAASSKFNWCENVIIGNTAMYGATGGALFAAGRAGERFGVRNSGGIAVVEGLGDHGCEYMTAGVVVILGEVGRNFAAGMTGGVAYVVDECGSLHRRCNLELVRIEAPDEQDARRVHTLIERHYALTSSPRARDLLLRWETSIGLLVKVATQAEATSSERDEPRVINLSFTSEGSALAAAD